MIIDVVVVVLGLYLLSLIPMIENDMWCNGVDAINQI